MRRIVAIVLVVLIIVNLVGCKPKPITEYTNYSNSFFDTFNTWTVVVAYTRSEEEFNNYFDVIHKRFQQLHKLYDKYNNYDGINNIKTINDNAGIQPVKVDKEIIDLLIFAKVWSDRTGGLTNIALGPVLEIWHNYRSDGIYDPENAQLPPLDILKSAAAHTSIDKVIVDIKNSTVYLEDSSMRLDVGAIAKGYATEIIAKEVYSLGMTSGVISAGGNVRTIGKPLDGVRDLWGIGIQNPNSGILSDNKDIETVFVKDRAVVSSGDYQRFYYVGDELIHHLIDPKTLMPANYYRAITVITPDSGVADFLSTALFLLPLEESKALAEDIGDVDVIWVMPDGSIQVTDGMKQIMKSQGATGQTIFDR